MSVNSYDSATQFMRNFNKKVPHFSILLTQEGYDLAVSSVFLETPLVMKDNAGNLIIFGYNKAERFSEKSKEQPDSIFCQLFNSNILSKGYPKEMALITKGERHTDTGWQWFTINDYLYNGLDWGHGVLKNEIEDHKKNGIGIWNKNNFNTKNPDPQRIKGDTNPFFINSQIMQDGINRNKSTTINGRNNVGGSIPGYDIPRNQNWIDLMFAREYYSISAKIVYPVPFLYIIKNTDVYDGTYYANMLLQVAAFAIGTFASAGALNSTLTAASGQITTIMNNIATTGKLDVNDVMNISLGSADMFLNDSTVLGMNKTAIKKYIEQGANIYNSVVSKDYIGVIKAFDIKGIKNELAIGEKLVNSINANDILGTAKILASATGLDNDIETTFKAIENCEMVRSLILDGEVIAEKARTIGGLTVSTIQNVIIGVVNETNVLVDDVNNAGKKTVGKAGDFLSTLPNVPSAISALINAPDIRDRNLPNDTFNALIDITTGNKPDTTHLKDLALEALTEKAKTLKANGFLMPSTIPSGWQNGFKKSIEANTGTKVTLMKEITASKPHYYQEFI